MPFELGHRSGAHPQEIPAPSRAERAAAAVKDTEPQIDSVSFTAFELRLPILSVFRLRETRLASARQSIRRCRRSEPGGFLMSVMRICPGDRVSLSLDQIILFQPTPERRGERNDGLVPFWYGEEPDADTINKISHRYVYRRRIGIALIAKYRPMCVAKLVKHDPTTSRCLPIIIYRVVDARWLLLKCQDQQISVDLLFNHFPSWLQNCLVPTALPRRHPSCYMATGL